MEVDGLSPEASGLGWSGWVGSGWFESWSGWVRLVSWLVGWLVRDGGLVGWWAGWLGWVGLVGLVGWVGWLNPLPKLSALCWPQNRGIHILILCHSFIVILCSLMSAIYSCRVCSCCTVHHFICYFYYLFFCSCTLFVLGPHHSEQFV